MNSIFIILAFIIGLLPFGAVAFYLWRRNEQLTNLLLREQGKPKLARMTAEEKSTQAGEAGERRAKNWQVIGNPKNPLAEFELEMLAADNEEYEKRNG